MTFDEFETRVRARISWARAQQAEEKKRMPNITAENRKRIAEMLEQGMPGEQIAKRMRSRGVSLSTVLEMEAKLSPVGPASTKKTPVVSVNPGLMKKLAELVGVHGLDQVEATLEHVRSVSALLTRTPLDEAHELADDEAVMSHQMNGAEAAEQVASA